MVPKENISSKALLISLPGKFVVFMMETEFPFLHGPYFVESKILPTVL